MKNVKNVKSPEYQDIARRMKIAMGEPVPQTAADRAIERLSGGKYKHMHKVPQFKEMYVLPDEEAA
jgi:uncharacterized protein YdbL (DUF1318 family)